MQRLELMRNGTDSSSKQLFRLWSLPGLIGGVCLLIEAWQTDATHRALPGVGLLLGSLFALRHNLVDLSAQGTDPKNIGAVWCVILGASFC
jgi:hypothetical protein